MKQRKEQDNEEQSFLSQPADGAVMHVMFTSDVLFDTEPSEIVSEKHHCYSEALQFDFFVYT